MYSYSTRSKSNGSSTIKTNSTIFTYKPQDEGGSSSGNQLGEITFTQHDRLLLKAPKFLNDTIVSFFMQHYLDNNVQLSIKQRIHVFNSFFYAKIKSIKAKQNVKATTNNNNNNNTISYNCASRWLKGVELFGKDFLIMPVCEKDHWVLVIVCYASRTPSVSTDNIADDDLYEPAVFVMDSWFGSSPAIKKILNQFLSYQWQIEKKTKRNFPIHNAKKQGIKLIFPKLPQQKNNYNCGVYMLNYFYCFLRNPRQAYIGMFRDRDMTMWFGLNNVDVYRERTRMIKMVELQAALWASTRETSNSNQTDDVESPTKCDQLIETIDDNEMNVDDKDSIVVINIA